MDDPTRTRNVINRIIAETYPSSPSWSSSQRANEQAKPRRKLKSFKEVTGGLTRVIISPKIHDAENNVNVSELSQATLRGYVKGSSKDLNREMDANRIKDTGGSKVTARMKKRQAGLFQAAERLVGMPKESAPTNSMGLSSSAHGTGNIDTFDPLLGRKKRKRKPATKGKSRK